MPAETKRTRGERAGLTRERVLDAAVELVDREGLKALTMRRLGAALGVEAMTLYHHVPGKDALLDGLVERVFAGAAPVEDAPDGWRSWLRAYADALRTTLLGHPDVLPLAAARPAATPAALDAVERGLRVLTSAGFPLGRALHALNSLTLLVVSHAAAECALATPDGPGSAADLAGLDPDRYPLTGEAARTGAGTDDAERFAYAVEALITGFGAGAGD
ncbi:MULTISPECIES: TetR/AcrR family transcriptional regulator C-terminal domain-containing protein [Streptomyces]|uniref:TetR/AcrR family transcriptional regulator C-terminal domain-containing protein n=1 Tax=Streptomyces TaxID=1883 RepID=UPI00163D1428|nr:MULTISPECIES: TetR/AcrR family transcriptional regulator C-terminal domain-containing protein [Streptomyces]MBC2878622.1 TetR/AcrR family transcriptional regulator C-terminal domain-containing protein [Streptomyces sp. TYQ1024]UBI35275.1 TetR/AcrR family transcriptional regulator C-terminal domain-containing protein [Streptomyces mobaraensis]UKW27865.1 TetR/AcrR family transcriptional regulator C-terminal domain-containing protein [Streptomyces sp. TYQ1024]